MCLFLVAKIILGTSKLVKMESSSSKKCSFKCYLSGIIYLLFLLAVIVRALTARHQNAQTDMESGRICLTAQCGLMHVTSCHIFNGN